MKNRKILIVTLLVIVILVVGLILLKNATKVEQTNSDGEEILTKEEEDSQNTFSLFDSIKNETITAENYEDIMNRIGNEVKDEDDAYYFVYSCLYYVAKDGMEAAFSSPDDETAMYKRIYGKTVKQLIEEGKQLMEENDMTVERYKQTFQDIAENQ